MLLERGLTEKAKGEIQLQVANGKCIPVYLSLARLQLDDMPSVTMIVTDLTERKRAEEILVSEQLARSILEQAAEAIVVCDAAGYIIRISQAAISLCGQNPLQKRFEDVFQLNHPLTAKKRGTPETQLGLVARILKGETFRNLEAELVRPNCLPCHLLVSGRPLRDARQQIVGCTLTLNDITERRRSDEALRRLNDELQQHAQQLDTVNQELNVANEELAATNEELTTANDQLEAEIAHRIHAEDQLRRHQEWLRVTLTSIGDGVIATDVAGHVTFINPVASALTGWLPEEAQGRPLSKIFPIIDENTRTPVQDIVMRVLKDKRVVGLGNHTALCTRGGREVPVEDSGAPILDESGHVLGAVVVFHDVTEKRRAQEALAQAILIAEKNRLILETVIQQMPAGIIITDATGTEAKNNQEMDRIWKRPMLPSENINGHAYVAFHPDGQQYAPDEWPLTRALDKGEVTIGEEMTIQRGDGTTGTVLVSSSPIRDQSGQTIAGVVIDTDITELKAAAEAVRQSEERYRTLFNTLIEGFCIVEVIFDADNHPIDYRFLEINPAFEKQTGLHDAQGKRMRELAPEHEAYWFEIYGHIALTGEPARFENEAKALNRWYEVFAYRLGEPAARRVAILFNDITLRKHAEQEREDLLRREQVARSEAESAVQVRDRFISVASHELKTPLTSIKGYAELLSQRGRQAGLDPPFQRMANTIDTQTERLEKLIEAMLDISRLERGQLRLECAPVDLEDLAACVVREVQPTLRVHKIEFGSGGKPVIVQGDETRLEQVLQNLIQNAIKYSPTGGPIRVQLTQDPARVRIAVTDHGIGIPRAAQVNLFTQFYRAANAEAYHISGLGVGLYLAREIMRLHGGDIEVESEEGRGSTFTVWLPLPQPDPVAV